MDNPVSRKILSSFALPSWIIYYSLRGVFRNLSMVAEPPYPPPSTEYASTECISVHTSCIRILSLDVCLLYPKHVNTAKPIWPKFVARIHMSTFFKYNNLNRKIFGIVEWLKKIITKLSIQFNLRKRCSKNLYSTGCPNKYGNSVTNSISSFQIILWFSLVIPTEKAVICKSFVCYVYILFVYVLTAYSCT